MNPSYRPLRLFVRIEDKMDFIVVEQYSLVKLLTELGGIASFLFGASRLLTHKVSRNWFIGALTSTLFRVRERLSVKQNYMIKSLARSDSGFEMHNNLKIHNADAASEELQANIETLDKITHKDIDNIIYEVTQTNEIEFTSKDYFKDLVCFFLPCFKFINRNSARNQRKNDQEKIFKIGKKRTNKMLDVVDYVR